MNGYTKIPNELMRSPLLSPTEKTVWGVIASMAPGFNPTIGQLCKMVQCHRDTWRAAVKWLERFGMVAVEHRPNGVTYTVVEDTAKWHITPREGRKNSYPMKISEGRKISTPEGMKKPTPKGMKISTPSEEQEKNNRKLVVDARARIREEVMTDAMVERGCLSLGIDRGTYENLAYQVFTDWDFQSLPDSEWNTSHFLAVMRYKVADYKKQNNGRQTDKNRKAVEAGAAAIAALAAQSGKPVDAPF